MKVLITGGGGFLGSSLAKKLLILGNEVTILGRQSYPKLKKMFRVVVIPQTLKYTNLIKLQKGDIVNIEFDILSKY